MAKGVISTANDTPRSPQIQPLSYHNGHVYVKWIKNALTKRHEFLNIYRRKAINGKKEIGFKNGRLLADLK
jgi:hypothetical protein